MNWEELEEGDVLVYPSRADDVGVYVVVKGSRLVMRPSYDRPMAVFNVLALDDGIVYVDERFSGRIHPGIEVIRKERA